MKYLDLSVRFDPPNNTGTFSGYAVKWGETNHHRERYEPGVFANSLAEHARAGTMPIMDYGHDTRDIPGVWETIKEDDIGLYVSGRLLTTTRRGAEVHELLKAKALSGLSIGFRSISDKLDKNGIRVMTAVDLQTISIVALPSMQSARVSQVRNSPTGGKGNVSAFISHCQKAARSISNKG